MIEDVLNDMRGVLVRHLETELSRQDGKYGDTVKLEMPRSILLGDEGVTEEGFPIVCLYPESTDQILYATAKKDVSHSISIRIAVTDSDEDRSQKKLWRTMRAIENALEINAPGTGVIIDYKTEGLDFNADHFGVNSASSTEKCGTIAALILERVDAYNASQL